MERYSEVIGLPILCVDNGKKIGTVKDMIFCPKYREVKAILLERKGCQVSKKVIWLKDIVCMGRDAVIVNDCGCTVRMSEVKNDRELKDRGMVKGLRVYSKSGEDLGMVEDILFDYKTRMIEGVEISDGLLQDIVKGRNILPLCGKVEFSEENILVEREAVEEMMSTGGGLKKKLLGE